MIAVLAKWVEIAGQPRLLPRLAGALRRAGYRVIDAVDGGARLRRRASERAEQRKAWRKTAKDQSRVNAEAVQFDGQVLGRLEEMIAGRIGRPVRHVASEPVLCSGDGIRAHLYRRAFTMHWFEVSGVLDGRLNSMLDANKLLGVFVKSASRMRLCAPLEFLLSEQRGKGFRAPYFFGAFELGDLKIGAWECVETKRLPFDKRSSEEQRRMVEAIAALNALGAAGTAPVMTRWTKLKPRWFHGRYHHLEGAACELWTELHGRTSDVMEHQDWLMRQLEPGGRTFLTHNDLRIGGNMFVPPDGDVVVFDWELATLSVPGADLGGLTRVDSGDQLLECYVSSMARHGFGLDLEAVRFTVEVLEGLRSVRSGWRELSAGDVERGLALLTRHLR